MGNERAMERFNEIMGPRIKEMQEAQKAKNKANILLIGKSGVGKTHLLRTLPTPIYAHSFDPGGQDTNSEYFGPNYIVHSKFENITYKNPQAFSNWEKEMKFLIQEDFFSRIGTFVVDSFTGWGRALSYYISSKMATETKAGAKGREYGRLHLSDYNVTLNVTISWLHQLMALPCHVVIVGHIVDKWDDDTGAWLGNQLSYQGRVVIDETINCFSELYVLKAKFNHSAHSTNTIRKLYTSPNSFFEQAKTRKGSEKYLHEEEPDLGKLLKKAGFNTTNKPPLEFD